MGRSVEGGTVVDIFRVHLFLCHLSTIQGTTTTKYECAYVVQRSRVDGASSSFAFVSQAPQFVEGRQSHGSCVQFYVNLCIRCGRV